MTSSRIEVTRGGTVESSHRVHAAVSDAEGRLLHITGDPDRVTFFRSSAKPFQALPLVEDGVVEAFGLTDAELAVCCASHSGEEGHVALVRGILQKGGLTEDALACGPTPPFNRRAADDLVRAGVEAGRIHNNCSGKHAGMLLLAMRNGWDIDGYEREGHPVQKRMLYEVERWSGVPAAQIPTGIDGCGVVCFALSVADMARAYARFLAAADRGEAPGEVVRAMTRHPHEVAGTHRLCTDVMRTGAGRILAKVGAEGVYGAGLKRPTLGVSLKVEDGTWRAAEVALITLLDELDALDTESLELMRQRYQVVTNTLGEAVGELRGLVDLRSPADD